MMHEPGFREVLSMIQQARDRLTVALNTALIDLYWHIGQSISKRIESAEWGASIVEELANYIAANDLDAKGFSSKNLWRMKQFFETYRGHPELSPVVREISWTNNMIIVARCKSMEERFFYLQLAIREKYSKRELDRQISAGLFERFALGQITGTGLENASEIAQKNELRGQLRVRVSEPSSALYGA